MQEVLKQMSSRHVYNVQDLKLATIMYSPQAWTCKELVISIICSFSFLLRGSLGEGKVERGVGGHAGDKGNIPHVPVLFPLPSRHGQGSMKEALAEERVLAL